MVFIEVSPEMTTLVCLPADPASPVPPDPVLLAFHFGDDDEPERLTLDLEPSACAWLQGSADCIVFLVARHALARIGGRAMLESGLRDFHLSADLRALASAIREPAAPEGAREVYQLAKSLELLCEIVRRFAVGEAAPFAHDAVLSDIDVLRILKARRFIDEHWHEKLTLEALARACGLNRAKLTRGFREMFECTVAEALAERRLGQASRLLLTTDLPVSSVGYRAGYLNNASFARAFGRRFGRSPSDFRASGVAA